MKSNAVFKEFIKRAVTWLGIALVLLGGYYLSPSLSFAQLVLIFGWILVIEWPTFVHARPAFIFLTPLYPLVPMMATLHFFWTHIPAGFLICAYPFYMAFAADTLAYLVGRVVGRRKLCPRISPGKTWEGLCGAMLLLGLFQMAMSMAGISLPLASTSAVLSFCSGACVALVAALGDLFESLLKRRAGLKDTGSLLPGHGGVLDRFDAVLFTGLLLFASHAWVMFVS